MSWESPVLARVWLEGRRTHEESVISVECDGNEIEIHTDDDKTIELAADEWDELTVQYQ